MRPPVRYIVLGVPVWEWVYQSGNETTGTLHCAGCTGLGMRPPVRYNVLGVPVWE